jgi:hypothetical protein
MPPKSRTEVAKVGSSLSLAGSSIPPRRVKCEEALVADMSSPLTPLELFGTNGYACFRSAYDDDFNSSTLVEVEVIRLIRWSL